MFQRPWPCFSKFQNMRPACPLASDLLDIQMLLHNQLLHESLCWNDHLTMQMLGCCFAQACFPCSAAHLSGGFAWSDAHLSTLGDPQHWEYWQSAPETMAQLHAVMSSLRKTILGCCCTRQASCVRSSKIIYFSLSIFWRGFLQDFGECHKAFHAQPWVSWLPDVSSASTWLMCTANQANITSYGQA